jgi:hypothetical protein
MFKGSVAKKKENHYSIPNTGGRGQDRKRPLTSQQKKAELYAKRERYHHVQESRTRAWRFAVPM